MCKALTTIVTSATRVILCEISSSSARTQRLAFVQYLPGLGSWPWIACRFEERISVGTPTIRVSAYPFES